MKREDILKWILLLAVLITFLWFVSGCAATREELYRQQLDQFKEDWEALPETILVKCADLKALIPPTVIEGETDEYHSKENYIKLRAGRWYNLDHELQHWANHQGKLSWQCLDEISAYYRGEWKHEKRKRERLEAMNRMRR